MSFAQGLSFYINLNLLVAVAFGLLWLTQGLFSSLKMKLASKDELRLHYLILLAVFALALAQPLFPKNEFLMPAAKVWSASSMGNFHQEYRGHDQRGFVSWNSSESMATEKASGWGILLGLLFLSSGALLMGRDLIRLLKIRKNSFAIRKIGRVHVAVNEQVQVPFCYWWMNEAHIILPGYLILHSENTRIAVTHELQHHRQGDTRWVYIMWGLRWICVFNPAIYLWNRWIMEIQEFACDEVLVDKGIDSQAYARCLVEVAQTALHQRSVSVCATGLTFLIERNILKRRIEKMLHNSSSSKTKNSVFASLILVLMSVLVSTAVASKGLVQDRRINMAQAQALVKKSRSQSGFPVVLNQRVLAQLNRFVGTPEGREFIRESLERMQVHKRGIVDQLLDHNMPMELLAIPLLESGYENLPQKKMGSKSAGLWQFIPSTAINYGLDVTAVKDDRLDIPMATDAALRYLKNNYGLFHDWSSAVLAYNIGERRVRNALDEKRTKDVWALDKEDYGDNDYLAGIMASIIIMRNPEIIE